MPLFQAFYFSPEVSRTLPPKYARKGGPTYSMLITFKQAHELWLQKKGSKVSFNFFYKGIPLSMQPKKKTRGFVQRLKGKQG